MSCLRMVAFALILAGSIVLPATALESQVPSARRAWIFLLQGDYEQARDLAANALSSGNDASRASVCLIEALDRLGEGDQALTALMESVPADADSLPSLLGRGKRERLQRKMDAAELLFSRALRAASVRGDSSSKLVAIEQIAHLYQDTGRFPEAADLHRTSLALAGALKDSLVLISSGYGLAYCLIPEGKRDESERLAREALARASRWQLHRWIGDLEALLATLAWFDLRLEETLVHFEKAEEAYRATDDGSRRASCKRRIAATRISLGAYPAALEELREAREIAFQAGDSAQASFCLEHLGSINSDLGNLGLAKEQWEEALGEGRASWPPEWKNSTLVNLGSLLVGEGRYGEALGYFEEASRVLERSKSRLNVPGTLTQLALCLRESGRAREALERLRPAKSEARQYKLILSEAIAEKEIGLCHLALNEPREAKDAFERAARLARGHGFHRLDLQILEGQAQVARAMDDRQGALRFLEQGMAIGERVRNLSREASSVQQAIFGRSRTIYERTIELLSEMYVEGDSTGLAAVAFEVAQRAKARSLLDLLRESEVDLRVRADTTYQRREEEILRRMAELTASTDDEHPTRGTDVARELARLEDGLVVLEKELRSADPRYAQLRYPQPVTIEELRAGTLREGEVLLEYILGEEGSHLWAVTLDTLLFVRLPTQERIQVVVNGLLPLLKNYNYLGDDPTYLISEVETLSTMLVGPVRGLLGDADRLIISPDGILHLLPFEVLFSGEIENKATMATFSELPYLIQTIDLSYIPSGTALARFRVDRSQTRHVSSADLLLVGDPILDDAHDLVTFFRAATDRPPGSLPHVSEEIDRLEQLAQSGIVRSLTGSTATLLNLRTVGERTRYRLVHFATHGVFNERRPRFSGVLLTPEPEHGDDGFLTIDEIFSLDLDCDQVVLSACSSALGKSVAGEGVVGLTRGFLYAGARSVIATLWTVSGEATPRFMSTFYQPILEDSQVDRVRALSQAKRVFIRGGLQDIGRGVEVDFAHPYFWAPFVFAGADR